MAPGQEANGDDLVNSFQFSTEYNCMLYVLIRIALMRQF